MVSERRGRRKKKWWAGASASSIIDDLLALFEETQSITPDRRTKAKLVSLTDTLRGRRCPSDWWRCFLHLLSTSGLRLNEGLHLRWDHLDFDSGFVLVRRQNAGRFTVDGQSYQLLPWMAEAKASYREIPLPHEAVT